MVQSQLTLLLARLRLLEASGDAFQRLVWQVMRGRFPGFQEISPWGTEGDAGNDGWIPDEGHYVQVYGPRASSGLNPASAARKVRDDFGKLLTGWPGVQRYSFVLNDRFDGIPKPVAQALLEIEKQHHGVTARAVPAAELLDWFMALPSDKQYAIIGGVPGDMPEMGWAGPLGDILRHLADTEVPPAHAESLDLVAFDEKIVINGLSPYAASLLRASAHYTHALDEFFHHRSAWERQHVAQRVIDLYEKAKVEVPGALDDAADLRLVFLIEQLRPETVAHPHSVKSYRQAAAVVLAKYFEACDVFETRPRGPTA